MFLDRKKKELSGRSGDRTSVTGQRSGSLSPPTMLGPLEVEAVYEQKL